MKKVLIALLILLPLPAVAEPVTLQWNLRSGERLEVVKTARIDYLVNSVRRKRYEERNIVDLTCTGREEKANRVHGVFSVYERQLNDVTFRLERQDKTDFIINSDGTMDISDRYFMPNLRHIPAFPEQAVQPGQKWTVPGELLLDNFSVTFSLKFDVEYILREIVKEEGRDIAVIEYEFVLNRNLQGLQVPADFPDYIKGVNKGLIRWDIAGGRPITGRDEYFIMFAYARGQQVEIHEFRMAIDSESAVFNRVTEDEKKTERDRLANEIPKDSGITVDTNDQGLVLRLGQILFDHDSAALRADSRQVLTKVADIVRERYANRELIIEGHTDNTGTHEYNMSLSEQRARTVSDFLRQATGNDKVSFRGLGPDRPLGDNNTVAGRSANRRVEVIIKMN